MRIRQSKNMPEHGLKFRRKGNPYKFSRFTERLLIYICVAAILYIFYLGNWKTIGQHIKVYTNTKIHKLLNASIIKSFNFEGKGKQNDSIDINEKKSDNRDHKKYRIDTKSCKINDLPIFDQETRPLFKNSSETKWVCEHKKYNKIKIDRIDETTIQLNWTVVGYKPLCYYRQLSRGENDFQFIYGEFIGPISQSKIKLPDYFFVHIVCYNNESDIESYFDRYKFNESDPNLIHNEIIPLIPFINKTTNSSLPNVLLLAIDATSYINFKRHFIRTEKLLKKQKFFELRGYNKVGANTFPNMIPFLTGHNSNELVSDEKLKNIFFDDWPIIWKMYSKKGYVTTFLEEMSWCGLFHFNLYGFRSQPTDYYMRPFHMKIMSEKYKKFCYLNETETERCLHWTYDYIKGMNKRNQKYFAYISISEMTHDWIEAGHYMDVPYFELLSKLFDENLLENTLLIFFSDHGFRYGPLRQTHTGEVENRLPFIFIHLPKNFNSDYTENLRQNQYRLTTAFDIHATLTHLVQGTPDHSLPHGLSLFDKVISDSRDCSSSSIPDMYCSCYDDIEIQDFDLIKPNKTLQKIVNKINSFTVNVRSKCAEYSVHSIHKLYERSYSRTDSEYELGDAHIYIVQLYVNPGMALFETVIRSYDKQNRFELIGEITRINLYGKQAHCLNDKLLNNYCFCNDLLT